MFLYWNNVVTADGGQTDLGLGDLSDTPPLLLHVTGACFTDKVRKGSRTVVSCESNESKGPICVLTQGSNENQTLDLILSIEEGEQPTFAVAGQNPSSVALSGYIQPAQDMMEGESFADEEELAERMAFGQDAEESPNVPMRHTEKARKRNLAEATADSDDESPELVEPPKKKQKKGKKKKNQEANGEEERKVSASPKRSPKNSPAATPGEKKKKVFVTLKGGLRYKDLRVGSGPALRKGQDAGVYYVGQLTEKKAVFDKCISGAPFSFSVGNGEVIRGWDEGLVGMQVGGKRRLIVPAKMAYGPQGSPPEIPGNCGLTFTIELKTIS